MSTETVETSTFPTDDWHERTERFYTGEALEDPTAREAPLTPEERQRQLYGGISVGAAFHGWLSALGVVALLAGLVAAVTVLLGLGPDLTRTGGATIGATAMLVATIGASLMLAVGVFAGAYAAGRLVRFDGGRQGVSVWVLTLVTGLVAAGLAVVVDSQYALRTRPSSPDVLISRDDLLLGGGITLGVVAVLTLLLAIGGGKLGVRYHAKVDRAATHEPILTRAEEKEARVIAKRERTEGKRDAKLAAAAQKFEAKSAKQREKDERKQARKNRKEPMSSEPTG